MRMKKPKNMETVLENCDFYYDLENQFNNDNEIHLEIGMGKGNFILNMAKEYPDINFIGIEKQASVASIAIKKITEEKLSNVKVIINDIVETEELLTNKIDKIYLNFSDPWHKDRHAKRRLTHENQLKFFDKLFNDKKVIIMKTDNDNLFEFSLESLKNYGYNLKHVTYDLHNEDIFNIKTEYEEKFSSKGIKIKYLLAEKES